MKVTHLSLARPVQTEMAMLRGNLTEVGTGGGYKMLLLSRLGLVEVRRDNWPKPVYLLRECIDSIGTESPLTKSD